MKVIADTNIIISALISLKGKESDIILNPAYDFRKYTCNFLYDDSLPGDVKPVGEGVLELRIDYGPGYSNIFCTARTGVGDSAGGR